GLWCKVLALMRPRAIPGSWTPGHGRWPSPPSSACEAKTMMDLRAYRSSQARLADWLPWAGLVAPGVIVNKDGAFQRTLRFRGPDLDSSTLSELMGASERLDNALKRFGSGWCLHVEARRQATSHYPQSQFPDALSWLIDEERAQDFATSG